MSFANTTTQTSNSPRTRDGISERLTRYATPRPLAGEVADDTDGPHCVMASQCQKCHFCIVYRGCARLHPSASRELRRCRTTISRHPRSSASERLGRHTHRSIPRSVQLLVNQQDHQSEPHQNFGVLLPYQLLHKCGQQRRSEERLSRRWGVLLFFLCWM